MTITNLTWTPPEPRPGNNVQFHATVTNQGNAATPDIVGVGFTVSDGFFGWGTAPPMATGQTVIISLNAGPSGSRWVPPSSDTFTVTAMVDDINRFNESNEGNNVT